MAERRTAQLGTRSVDWRTDGTSREDVVGYHLAVSAFHYAVCVVTNVLNGLLRSASVLVYSIRCQRRTFTCAQGDVDCLYAPLSYSANFISLPLVAALIVPIELFTMRGPVAPSRRMQFELELVSAVVQPSTNSQRSATDGRVAGHVTRNYFDVDQVQKVFAGKLLLMKHRKYSPLKF
jgi:hypothetical protein